jgi:hypothetical protein
MSRALAIMLFSSLALGCHGQSGNPFMRTTVPPPATGVGAPSDPYYNNSGGPRNGASAPPAAGPPGATPGPVVTPPVVPPPEKRFSAPGGFNFPQGSINHRKAVDPSPTDFRPSTSSIVRAARPRSIGESSNPGSAKLRVTELAVDEPASEQRSASGREQTPENTPLELRDDKIRMTAGTASLGVAADGTLAVAEEQEGGQPVEQDPVATAEMNAVEPDSTELALAEPEEFSEGRAVQPTESTATDNGSVVRILSSPESDETPADSVVTSIPSKDATVTPAASGLTIAPAIADNSATAKLSVTAGNAPPKAAGSENKFYYDRANSRPREQQAAFHGTSGSGVQFAIGQTPTTGTSSTPDSSDSYSHHVAYTWLRGKLEYSTAAKRWKLRYIPIDGQTDQFGGSVILANSPLLENLRPGEMVTAEGSIGNSPAQSGSFSPLFELRSIKSQR